MKLYGKELADKLKITGVYEDGEPKLGGFDPDISNRVVYSYLFRSGEAVDPYAEGWQGLRECLKCAISAYEQEQRLPQGKPE